jgi:hypothetical protein
MRNRQQTIDCSEIEDWEELLWKTLFCCGALFKITQVNNSRLMIIFDLTLHSNFQT